MNAIPFVISLLGFMFFLQPAFAQKLLRTEYQMMFTEFPVLSDSLMTDKYRTSFYQVNEKEGEEISTVCYIDSSLESMFYYLHDKYPSNPMYQNPSVTSIEVL